MNSRLINLLSGISIADLNTSNHYTSTSSIQIQLNSIYQSAAIYNHQHETEVETQLVEPAKTNKYNHNDCNGRTVDTVKPNSKFSKFGIKDLTITGEIGEESEFHLHGKGTVTIDQNLSKGVVINIYGMLNLIVKGNIDETVSFDVIGKMNIKCEKRPSDKVLNELFGMKNVKVEDHLSTTAETEGTLTSKSNDTLSSSSNEDAESWSYSSKRKR